MIPEDLGYNDIFEKFRIENDLHSHEIGRIIAEHKERYIILTPEKVLEAEITGNIRFTASGREDFPAVGDWVAFITYDHDFAIIHKIFPRYSVIKRQAIGNSGNVQIIAANIDYAFLVQAIDRDFNINRLERYLTICNSSGVKPIIVLTKIDLINNIRLEEISESIKERIKDVPVVTISNETQDGYGAIRDLIEKGKTYCMLGSSGVGKSTLINNLAGASIMMTDAISISTNKGRHVTSHRELILLDSGGILVDNPGMREVGVTDVSSGLDITFDLILKFSKDCKFKDCTHIHETGCAVLEAIKKGNIDKNSYENYLKMTKEKEHFESTAADRKKKDKQLGKLIKNYQKKDVKQRKN